MTSAFTLGPSGLPASRTASIGATTTSTGTADPAIVARPVLGRGPMIYAASAEGVSCGGTFAFVKR